MGQEQVATFLTESAIWRTDGRTRKQKVSSVQTKVRSIGSIEMAVVHFKYSDPAKTPQTKTTTTGETSNKLGASSTAMAWHGLACHRSNWPLKWAKQIVQMLIYTAIKARKIKLFVFTVASRKYGKMSWGRRLKILSLGAKWSMDGSMDLNSGWKKTISIAPVGSDRTGPDRMAGTFTSISVH